MPTPLVRTVTTPAEFRAAAERARTQGARVGLVPTMGALHDGHLSLVHLARERASFVAVSIFVNPTQFGPNEDLAKYPRDLAGDVAKLAGAGADLVFSPDVDAMYPPGDETRVHVGATAAPLCGAFRPGHFEGVATVVSKLFALVGPSVVVFGRKDYQQLAVLRRVATDLFFPVDSVGVAMSSRNAYLSPDERVRARSLSRGLDAAWRAFESGERRVGVLRALAKNEVEATATSIDYVDVADPVSLAVLDDAARAGTRALVAIACRVGTTRLIDNVVLGEDPSPLAVATDRSA